MDRKESKTEPIDKRASRISRKAPKNVITVGSEQKKLLEIFNKYKTISKQKKGAVLFSVLHAKLLEYGIDIFEDDRTAEVIKTLPKFTCVTNFDNIKLELSDFQNFVSSARDFLFKCLEEKLALMNFNFLQVIVKMIAVVCDNNEGDKISCEIPHLSKQDPNLWGISVCSIDGQILNYGHYKAPFTLQDASKPFIYALALELFGEEVESYVGFQLSNLPIYARILHKNKLLNPAMESGAILLCSLIINKGIEGYSFANKFDYVISFLKKFCAKRHVSFNKSIYMSLSNNSQAYLAVAYFLESQKCFKWDHNIKEDLDFYLQIRSLEVTCESLSMIGATIANTGINPFTEERILSVGTCKKVFSYMQMLSGGTLSPYLIKLVCLPLVFSVSGLCLLILPWNLSFCFFSPKLHEIMKISSKPLQFITKLEKEFSMHPFKNPSGKVNALDAHKNECPNYCFLRNEACKGNVFNLARELDDGKQIHFVDYMEETLLHCAASLGHLDCVKYLLSLCPNLLTKTDKKGFTAEDCAKYFGHKEVTELLRRYECKTIGSCKQSILVQSCSALLSACFFASRNKIR